MENVVVRSSGEPYTPKNEFRKFDFFLHGCGGTHLLGVKSFKLQGELPN